MMILNLVKKIIPTLLIALTFTTVSAQKNKEVWTALHNNNRAEALQLVNKLNTATDIENLILKQMVRMENGKLLPNPDFVKEIPTYKDYEYYLFANWTLNYFYGNYLGEGFNSYSRDLPQLINAADVSNSTVKNGLLYLQSIAYRYKRDWDNYVTYGGKINAVTNWEYCGVFENLNASGIDMPYEPETETSDKVAFDAQSNGMAHWYKPAETNQPYQFFSNHDEFSGGVHYAQTFVTSATDQRVILRLGKLGAIRVWINDVLVAEDDDSYISELDALSYEVNLQKGVNRILVKAATNSGYPYFILRLEDLSEKPLKGYETSFKTRKYKKGTKASVNPKALPHRIESYFENKLNDTKSDTELTRFCLFLTYTRTGKLEKAETLLTQWEDEHPESSLIKSCLIKCYQDLNDNTELEKLQSNIERQDPDYYVSQLLQMKRTNELMKEDIATYEKKLAKIANATDYPYVKNLIDLLVVLRQRDMDKIRTQLDIACADGSLPSNQRAEYAEFYTKIFNDDNASITTLEKYNANEFNTKITNYLVYYYKKQNRTEDALQLHLNNLKQFDFDNDFHYKVIKLMHETGQYERSLPYIEKALKNYPDSFVFLQFKGDAYVQLNKKAEAVKIYKEVLKKHASDKGLRAKINDLESSTNPLNEFHTDNLYSYIQEKRNTIKDNNYGLNCLLNQTDILNYENGGGEYKTTLIYEITSQNGIDIFKEHDLGLSGNYLVKKSEAVKVNGDVAPADRNGAKLVFDDLQIGDVIYIDYESSYTKHGRFYKDYIHQCDFQGYHPIVKKIYRILNQDKKVNFKVTNGNGNPKYNTFKKGKFYVHEWSVTDMPGIPLTEDYMPKFEDVVPRLHISSIESWNEIATWYSDLVRKQLKVDETITQTIKSLFPDGYSNLSDTEKAERIYYYITDNFNYSYVSFRQGGYIPKKPSKTIKVKLGDCKDFSALFLILAQQVGLDANMVLILTSDYAKNELVLPDTGFNHCIVKVQLEGKEQFLELTDKYLPFKSLPISLVGASALVIPYDNTSNLSSELLHLDNVHRNEAMFSSEAEIHIGKEGSEVKLLSTETASVAAYTIELINTKEKELLKETFQEDIADRASVTITVNEVENTAIDRPNGKVSYATNLKADIKINKIGDLYTFEIPHFINPYNDGIVQEEERTFPINYTAYETGDSYSEKIIIKLEKGTELVDIPENVSGVFEKHKFSITFTKTKPDELEIVMQAKVDLTDIPSAAYPDYKKYINTFLDAREVLVSFKTINN